MLRTRRSAAIAAAAVVSSLCFATAASANTILMPTLAKSTQQQKAARAINPPAPPCPQYGIASCTPIPEAVATTLPYPGNMAYYGGNVQTSPHLYLVYWGWGEPSAWPAGTSCSPTDVSEETFSATIACDPDGAGKYMADWVDQLGGTDWAGSQTQYYETDSAGNQHHITNPTDQLAGIWVDDANPNTLPKTTLANAAGPTNTETVLGQEAERAVAHFGITDLHNSQILIVQPPGLSDPNALSQGYCAWHDMTYPGVEAGVFNGLQSGIAFTNMPYALAINSGGANDCGENAVNSGAAGKDDGFSIVLGHEIEETVTDPGAEDVVGDTPTYLGGWYDTVDANENGDKCAWVGEPLITGFPGEPNVVPIPGAMGNTTGNKGKKFAVQSLWSNDAAGGAGYCAGAGTDLPAGTNQSALLGLLGVNAPATHAKATHKGKKAKGKKSKHAAARSHRA